MEIPPGLERRNCKASHSVPLNNYSFTSVSVDSAPRTLLSIRVISSSVLARGRGSLTSRQAEKDENAEDSLMGAVRLWI
jgi:hypothetical protein